MRTRGRFFAEKAEEGRRRAGGGQQEEHEEEVEGGCRAHAEGAGYMLVVEVGGWRLEGGGWRVEGGRQREVAFCERLEV